MGRPDGWTLAAFALMVVLGGGNAVGIRFTVDELAPMWGAALRFGAAGLLFLALAAWRRAPVPRGRAALGAVLYGVIGFGGAYALGYWAFLEVSAGLGQTVLALVPLATLLLARAQRVEPLTASGMLGALVALGGVALVFFGSAREGAPLLPLVAMIAAAVCFAQAGIIVKRFPPVHPVAMNATGMLVGAILLLAASLALGEPRVLPTRAATWAAVAYLVLVGSVAVFALFLFVLARWSASATSFQFVLLPFVAVALGAFLRGETLTLLHAVGGLLVLAGVYVGALHGRPAGARPK